jgi:predicted transcriptional regulator
MDNKLRSVTIRVPPALWDRVERLAAADRRPASQLIRNLIEDAVAECRSADVTGAAHAA